MRKQRVTLIAVAALSITVLSASCGESSGRLSKAEFIAKADAICATGRSEIKALPNPRTYAELPAYIRKALPIQRRDIAEIRKLKPPKRDQREVELMLERVDRTNEAFESLRAGVESGDAAEANRAYAEVMRTNDDATRRAERYGLRVCGQPLERTKSRSSDPAL